MSRGVTVTRAAVGLLVVLTIPNSFEESWRHVRRDSGGMLAFGVVQLVYAVVAVVALERIARAPVRAWPWIVAWCAFAPVLAGVATVLFANAPMSAGVLAGASAAAVMAVIAIAWRRFAHRPLLAPASP